MGALLHYIPLKYRNEMNEYFIKDIIYTSKEFEVYFEIKFEYFGDENVINKICNKFKCCSR